MEKVKLSDEQKKAVQNIELGILIELNRICRKHNIPYALAYGTLIGTVRHKGFIPWDDDVDVCMLRKDYKKFVDICKTELDSKYFYQTNSTDKEYFHLFDKIRANNTIFRESFLAEYEIHHGVYIDIFPIDNIPNNRFKRMLQYYSFHFFRTGLMSKYMMIEARTGKKKIAAKILKILYAPFSLKYLYKKANAIASKYMDDPQNDVMSFYSPYRLKDVFQRNNWETMIDGVFEGQKILIPKNYDLILTQIYGDYMKLPPEDQRITRHDLVELKID